MKETGGKAISFSPSCWWKRSSKSRSPIAMLVVFTIASTGLENALRWRMNEIVVLELHSKLDIQVLQDKEDFASK